VFDSTAIVVDRGKQSVTSGGGRAKQRPASEREWRSAYGWRIGVSASFDDSIMLRIMHMMGVRARKAISVPWGTLRGHCQIGAFCPFGGGAAWDPRLLPSENDGMWRRTAPLLSGF